MRKEEQWPWRVHTFHNDEVTLLKRSFLARRTVWVQKYVHDVRPLLDHGAYELQRFHNSSRIWWLWSLLLRPYISQMHSIRKALHSQTGHDTRLTCSLLLGAGFDAYVVFGYARNGYVNRTRVSSPIPPLVLFKKGPSDSSRETTVQGRDGQLLFVMVCVMLTLIQNTGTNSPTDSIFTVNSISLERRLKKKKRDGIWREALMRRTAWERRRLAPREARSCLGTFLSHSYLKLSQNKQLHPGMRARERERERAGRDVCGTRQDVSIVLRRVRISRSKPCGIISTTTFLQRFWIKTRWERMRIFSPIFRTRQDGIVCLLVSRRSEWSCKWWASRMVREDPFRVSDARTIGSLVTGELPSNEDPRPPPSWVLPLTLLPSQLLSSPFGPGCSFVVVLVSLK